MQQKKKFKRTAISLCIALCIAFSLCLLLHRNDSNDPASKQVSALYLYGDLTEMESKKDVRSVTARFQQGNRQIDCHATMKIQGNSSTRYEKKNYTIKFYKDADHTKTKDIDVGWGKENAYCLKANWIDKTHSRNIVTARLAAEIQSTYNIMQNAPCNGLIDGFPVSVYINDDFLGLYTWNIPKRSWMFGMDDNDPNHIVLCGEDWVDAVAFKAEPDLTNWSVEVGPEDDETLRKFSRLVDFIRNSSDEEFKDYFGQYMDLDSALNYYILVDFAYLPDNTGKNMLMVTYDGNVWYPSLYDLDTSWGTSWEGTEVYDYANAPVNFEQYCLWAQRIKENFPQELHDRYFELRSNILTKDHVMNLFYGFDVSIPNDAKESELARWGTDIPGYDFAQIESYLDTMIPLLDEEYSNLVP